MDGPEVHGAADRTVVLLGPQRQQPTVRAAVAAVTGGDRHRPVAVVTAGWEEREAEDLELGEHLEQPVINLELHRRALAVFDQDPDLLAALQHHHDLLTEVQQLYRLQLRHLVPAAIALLRRDGTPELIGPQREAAFENLRALDRHHLEQVDALRQRSARDLALAERASLAGHRQELADILGRTGVLCIAGGHVGILFNRLWLFGVVGLLPAPMPVIGWSAGAMVLTERIVLFHDNPPEGRGNAEVLGAGLGLCRGIVALPHAESRLHLEDGVRVQLLSRRFPAAICATLDHGAGITCRGAAVVATETSRQLGTDGVLAPLAAQGGLR